MRTKEFTRIPDSIARRGTQVLDGIRDDRARELFRAFAKHDVFLDPTLVTDRALTFVDDIVKEDDPPARYVPADQTSGRPSAFFRFKSSSNATLASSARVGSETRDRCTSVRHSSRFRKSVHYPVDERDR